MWLQILETLLVPVGLGAFLFIVAGGNLGHRFKWALYGVVAVLGALIGINLAT